MFAHLIAHADWGSSPSKRVMALACWQGDHYLILPPQPVGDPSKLISTLILWLCEWHSSASTLFMGFDFPIGLPSAYARLAGINNFLEALPVFGQGQWSEFYQPAEVPSQISLYRPFYPARSGSARQQHLLDGLGVASMNELRRRCDYARPASHGLPARRAACPLFWTLGGQQVGKAAVSGWQQVIAPALASDLNVSIWPFSGRLAELLAARQHPLPAPHIVMAETYPAEFYTHLGIVFPRRRLARSGKRLQSDRQANAPALLNWAEHAGVRLHPELRALLLDGFGPSLSGDDPFDAVIGAMGMVNVVLGRRPPGETEEVRQIEGGILGEERQ